MTRIEQEIPKGRSLLAKDLIDSFMDSGGGVVELGGFTDRMGGAGLLMLEEGLERGLQESRLRKRGEQ
jgi:hypothetical protein